MTTTACLDLEDLPGMVRWLDRTIVDHARDLAALGADDPFGLSAEGIVDALSETLLLRRRLLGAASFVPEAPPVADCEPLRLVPTPATLAS